MLLIGVFLKLYRFSNVGSYLKSIPIITKFDLLLFPKFIHKKLFQKCLERRPVTLCGCKILLVKMF